MFLLPTVRDNLAANRDTDISALVVACWAFYSDRHASQDGKSLEINDVLADKLHNAASNNQIDSLSFLMLEEVFGKLVDEARFTASFQGFVERLYQQEPVLLISEKVVNNKLELARAC